MASVSAAHWFMDKRHQHTYAEESRVVTVPADLEPLKGLRLRLGIGLGLGLRLEHRVSLGRRARSTFATMKRQA